MFIELTTRAGNKYYFNMAKADSFMQIDGPEGKITKIFYNQETELCQETPAKILQKIKEAQNER